MSSCLGASASSSDVLVCCAALFASSTSRFMMFLRDVSCFESLGCCWPAVPLSPSALSAATVAKDIRTA